MEMVPDWLGNERIDDMKCCNHDCNQGRDCPNRNNPVKTATGLQIVAMACFTGLVVSIAIMSAYFLGSWIVDGIVMLAETVK